MSDFVNGYDSEFLEKLKEKSDIVEVVSSYVELKRKGRNYWACCPFHHEKTPSFAVNDSDQIFHCFGCNVGGDVITFVEMIESVDFVDAVKILADRAKMPLPEFKGDKELIEKKKKRDKLYSVLNEAKLYYIDNLIKNRPQNAVDYIRKRKLSQGSVRKFEIGFSSDSYSIINALLKKGFTKQELLDSGVAQIGKDNNSIYDTMSGRLVFPIIDKFDRCLGFSGRDITNTSYAKYKNTPETEVFHKSDCLFGINLVKKLKQELGLNYIIVCEGQMDVIAMHNAGFGNTVASLGTAFTDLHAKELSKLTNKVYLCFDGDSAGQHAAIKNCEPLLNINMEVRIVTLPDDLDPDEMLNERGKDALSEYINKAVDATEFKILHLQTIYDISDNIGKSKFLKDALDIVSKLSTSSEQELYLGTIRKITNISLDTLKVDLNRLINKNGKIVNNNVGDAEKSLTEFNLGFTEDKLLRAQKFVIASVLYNKDYVKDILDDLFIKNEKINKFYEFILQNRGNKISVSSEILSNFDLENNPDLLDIVNYNFDAYKQNANEYYLDCLRTIKSEKLKNDIKEINEKIKNCTDENDKKTLINSLTLLQSQLYRK